MQPAAPRTDKSPTAGKPWNDCDLIDYLRQFPGATVSHLAAGAGVTPTAIRQRLTRLLDRGMVERISRSVGRGRPTHEYRLTAEGVQSAGTNYHGLAHALWDEVRSIDDLVVRRGLLARLAGRLAAHAQSEIEGITLAERMASLSDYMLRRGIPFQVSLSRGNSGDGRQIEDVGEGLPVLTALACPYPDLAERDRSVCAMEKMVFAEVLGSDVKLSSCRLDGAPYCTFEPPPGEAAPAVLG